MRKIIDKQLGQLLIEKDIITPKQLESALKLQGEKGGLIGQILVSLGYATEEDIAQAITVQYGFPYLPLKGYEIDKEVISLIPEHVARQYGLIPIDKIGDTLTIAMSNPLNNQAVEDIEMLTHCSAQVFVSTLSDLNETIDKYYGKK
jgi:type IV pilus assembly protein PilB